MEERLVKEGTVDGGREKSSNGGKGGKEISSTEERTKGRIEEGMEKHRDKGKKRRNEWREKHTQQGGRSPRRGRREGRMKGKRKRVKRDKRDGWGDGGRKIDSQEEGCCTLSQPNSHCRPLFLYLSYFFLPLSFPHEAEQPSSSFPFSPTLVQ